MTTSGSDSKKRLALAVIDFLHASLKDGTVDSSDAESIEVATSCIADAFHVDPSSQAAVRDKTGSQSLLSIYCVYEKLKDKTSPTSSGSSSTGEAGSSTSSAKMDNQSAPNPDAEAFKGKGNSAMAKKDYNAAIDLYSKALNISPLNPIYLSNRAAAYSACQRHSEASTDAEMAVAADPKYTKAWSRLGLARFALGDARGSMEAYKKGIDFEGNGGSDAMKKGFETAKRKVEEEERAGGSFDQDATEESARDSSPTGSGTGGMPDLSSLAGMLGGMGRGGGGMPDLGSIMSNPMFASMAQNLMNNPEMMSNLMSNPRLRQMADSLGGGGRGSGGTPDLAGLMSDPSIAEMARSFMGDGRGAGRGAPP